MPQLTDDGVIHDGMSIPWFGDVGTPERGYPDARSFARRFGLLVPATNTAMEHDLWSIIFRNQHEGGLRGVGLHTTPVRTPRPEVGTAAGLEEFKAQFLGGLEDATRTALLAAPQYMIMGLSLEHILEGIEPIREQMRVVETYCDLGWATWHDAIAAAFERLGVKRIGILTAWERTGNASAIRMFEDLGVEVVSSAGFSCTNVQHIAHVPDWAKEKAVLELLATPANSLDAVVQCGTNMSMADVGERLEAMTGIPVLGINAVTFWYALRENGFLGPLTGGGRLLRQH
jgi:maleate isomerase